MHVSVSGLFASVSVTHVDETALLHSKTGKSYFLPLTLAPLDRYGTDVCESALKRQLRLNMPVRYIFIRRTPYLNNAYYNPFVYSQVSVPAFRHEILAMPCENMVYTPPFCTLYTLRV